MDDAGTTRRRLKVAGIAAAAVLVALPVILFYVVTLVKGPAVLNRPL